MSELPPPGDQPSVPLSPQGDQPSVPPPPLVDQPLVPLVPRPASPLPPPRTDAPGPTGGVDAAPADPPQEHGNPNTWHDDNLRGLVQLAFLIYPHRVGYVTPAEYAAMTPAEKEDAFRLVKDTLLHTTEFQSLVEQGSASVRRENSDMLVRCYALRDPHRPDNERLLSFCEYYAWLQPRLYELRIRSAVTRHWAWLRARARSDLRSYENRRLPIPHNIFAHNRRAEGRIPVQCGCGLPLCQGHADSFFYSHPLDVHHNRFERNPRIGPDDHLRYNSDDDSYSPIYDD